MEPKGSDESDHSQDEGSPAKPRVKRGRALLRRTTDEEQVPFVTHAVSPEIVKEFMYELKSQWAIFGTSEVGVAARGALALKRPVVLFAHNARHEEILRAGLEAGITESCLAGGDFSSKTLVAAWQAAVNSDSESSSGGQTSEHASGSEVQGEGNEKEAKGNSKKDKKAGKDKKDTKKDKQKKHKFGNKKTKKDKKDKDKKDKKKSDGEKQVSASGSADVLKTLIAKNSGTQATGTTVSGKPV